MQNFITFGECFSKTHYKRGEKNIEGILHEFPQVPLKKRIEEDTSYFDLTFLPLNFSHQNFAGYRKLFLGKISASKT